METEKRPNFIKRAVQSVQEISSLAIRAPKKFLERVKVGEWEKERALHYLHNFQSLLQENDKEKFKEIFGEGTFNDFKLLSQEGFNSRVYAFTTEIDGQKKKWVFKLGTQRAPVKGWGDQSDFEYYKQFTSNFTKMYTVSKEVLPEFVPEPFVIGWVELRKDAKTKYRKRGRIAVIQPYLDFLSEKDINNLSAEEKQELAHQTDVYEQLMGHLKEEHLLLPDCLGNLGLGNTKVIRKNGKVHLSLPDIGLADLKAPLPITNAIMENAAKNEIVRLRNRFAA